MSRVSFNTVRSGRKPRGGNSEFKTLEQLKYENGDSKRVVFPIVDGGLVIFAQPFHKVLNSSVALAKANGEGTYEVHKIRCTHPYSQLADKDQKAVVETGEMCLFCNLAKYEDRKMWAMVAEQFGDDFKNLSKKEKKDFFDEYEKMRTVEASYYRKKNEETGDNETKTHFDMYILALEITLDGGNVKKIDGKAEYKPIIMPISAQRLEKFKTAVDDAISSGTLDEEILRPYKDGEEKVLIGWVDFRMAFPRSNTKMESGRNMTVTPMSARLSVVDDAFIGKFEDEQEEILKQAENTVNGLYKFLKVHNHEQAKETLVKGANYYNELEAEFRITESFENQNGTLVRSDDEMDAEIFEKVKEYLTDDSKQAETSVEETVEETVAVEEEVVEETVEEKPKTRRGGRAKKEENLELDADEDFSDFE